MDKPLYLLNKYINQLNPRIIMKKIVLTLGFAAASIFAVNAQDTPETLDQPIDETQEEVIEMEAEASEEVMDEVEESTNPIGEEEGIASITEAELPEEVTQAFQESEFSQASIQEAYVMDQEAVDKMTDVDAEQMYIGDQLPDKVYQIRVQEGDEQTILYFNEQGDLLASKSI